MPTIFITGGTGYMGRRLTGILLEKKYTVQALVRSGSGRPGFAVEQASPESRILEIEEIRKFRSYYCSFG